MSFKTLASKFFLNDLICLIQSHKPFTFIRFQSGEWHAVFGLRIGKQTGGGQVYYKSLCLDIKNTLERLASEPHENCWIGIHPDCQRPLLEKGILDFFSRHNFPPPLVWSDFLDKSVRDRSIETLFQCLQNQNKPIVVVSHPKNKTYLHPHIPFCDYIEVPYLDCWLHREEIYKSLEKTCQNNEEQCIFIFAAGLACKPWLYTLWKTYGQKHTFLDLGSVLDPYGAKINSRLYMNRVFPENITQENARRPAYFFRHPTAQDYPSIRFRNQV